MSSNPFGTQLRQMRIAAGLSLEAVERQTEGRWKAVVVGSWERGDRKMSMLRADEYVRDLFGQRLTFVAVDYADEARELASWIASQGVTDVEVRAAVALTRAARAQQDAPVLRSVAA